MVKGEGVAFYVRNLYTSSEIQQNGPGTPEESGWVNIGGGSSKHNIVVGINCRSPGQREEVDFFSLKLLADIVKKHEIAVMGLDNCWETDSAKHGSSNKFLLCLETTSPSRKWRKKQGERPSLS